jgi:hypothetical protein
MRYDRGKGWRDPASPSTCRAIGAASFAIADYGVGYPDWRPAVVVSREGSSATIGFTTATTGTLPSFAAALPKRGTGTPAFDFLRPGMIIAVKDEGSHYGLRSVPEISGGFVAQEVATGRVLAMQGGFAMGGGQFFNRATQANRQPGSTFKPVVYSAALDNGMTPASIIVDGPFCVFQSASLGNKCFRNFSGGNAGPQTMRWGLEQSRNLMTVRAASQTGWKRSSSSPRPSVSANIPITCPFRSAPATHGDEDYERFRDPRQSGTGDDADADRLYPGSERKGDLPRRHPPVRRLQRARLERAPDAAAAAPHQAIAGPNDGLSDGPHPGRRRAARHRAGAP